MHSTPVHAELVRLAPDLLTRHHARHYRGFANTQWRLFERTGELKPLLYTLRVLLTGIHLMRSHEVVADLPMLTGLVPAPAYVDDLVRAKSAAEHGLLSAVSGAPDHDRIAEDVAALHAELDVAEGLTALPEAPQVRSEMNELVVSVRLGTVG